MGTTFVLKPEGEEDGLVAVTNKLYFLDKPQVAGRSGSCDQPFSTTRYEQPYILWSRQHFELQLRDGRPHIKDLRSTNGTFVNRQPVRSDYVPLQQGDRIETSLNRFSKELCFYSGLTFVLHQE